MAQSNRRFQVTAAQRGTAFLPCPRRNLDLIFSQRFERTVDRDNTVSFHNLVVQIEPAEWRGTMAGCKVIVHQHLDETITLTIGKHSGGHYTAHGKLSIENRRKKAAEKTRGGKVRKWTFPPRLQIPHTMRDSHFTTAAVLVQILQGKS